MSEGDEGNENPPPVVFTSAEDAEGDLTHGISDIFGDDQILDMSAPSYDDFGVGTESGNGVDDDDYDDDDEVAPRTKRSRGSSVPKNMTEQERIQRRERNREHAKRSRVRKKFLLESLQQSVHALEDENEKMMEAIYEHLPEEAETLLGSMATEGDSIIASEKASASTTLIDPDYSLVKAMQAAQQNFVISDPNQPDNPIIFASAGFLSLTGYTKEQVIGRNCRFLQGAATEPAAVRSIREALAKYEDVTVCLVNYRADGTPFWNQLFVAPLKDGNGKVVNYLGVQCKVTESYAKAFMAKSDLEK